LKQNHLITLPLYSYAYIGASSKIDTILLYFNVIKNREYTI
jgi:hypothetical protein